MRRLNVFILISVFIFVSRGLAAEPYKSADKYESSTKIKNYGRRNISKDVAEDEVELRPGMEIKKVGSITMIVPEGTQLYRKNGRIFMEGPDEYAARRFKAAEGRFKALEERFKKAEEKLEALADEIKQLKTDPQAAEESPEF
jgi:chaperonin cofactor prefoldin